MTIDGRIASFYTRRKKLKVNEGNIGVSPVFKIHTAHTSTLVYNYTDEE